MPLIETRPARYPRRILCPTDFSPGSRRALQYAIAVASPPRAEIVVLHVLQLPLPAEDTAMPVWMPPEPGLRTALLERMARFAAPADAAGLVTRFELHEGDPADEILKATDELKADLIVMGSHGRRGVVRWVLGSHATRVRELATCPVLTVSGSLPEEEADAPVAIGEVLCAASGSEHSPATVDYACQLAEGAHSPLTLLHVFDPAQPAGRPSRPWRRPLLAASVPIHERTATGAARSEILRCAREARAGLIVIGLHDRGAGMGGRIGSTADAVVREAEVGVVTLRCAERAGPDREPREIPQTEVGQAR
jgi:nucleotide-binding universal stress UspA family protein